MDRDEALRIASDFFRSCVADGDKWKIEGPTEEMVSTLAGRQLHLIFSFRDPDSAEDLDWPLHVAVDPKTGRADMLR
ncbi:hypothetical protein ACWD62_16365 [Streptomyces sp. NPDC005146]